MSLPKLGGTPGWAAVSSCIAIAEEMIVSERYPGRIVAELTEKFRQDAERLTGSKPGPESVACFELPPASLQHIHTLLFTWCPPRAVLLGGPNDGTKLEMAMNTRERIGPPMEVDMFPPVTLAARMDAYRDGAMYPTSTARRPVTYRFEGLEHENDRWAYRCTE